MSFDVCMTYIRHTCHMSFAWRWMTYLWRTYRLRAWLSDIFMYVNKLDSSLAQGHWKQKRGQLSSATSHKCTFLCLYLYICVRDFLWVLYVPRSGTWNHLLARHTNTHVHHPEQGVVIACVRLRGWYLEEHREENIENHSFIVWYRYTHSSRFQGKVQIWGDYDQ